MYRITFEDAISNGVLEFENFTDLAAFIDWAELTEDEFIIQIIDQEEEYQPKHCACCEDSEDTPDEFDKSIAYILEDIQSLITNSEFINFTTKAK